MASVFIGTSGWNYDHWRSLFYPEHVPKRLWLEYFSQSFNTAEVNYSFYRLPSTSTYEKWLTQVPDGFVFTLKCSRLITHAKRLRNLGDLWENFIGNASILGDRLGPILFQLPENFQRDDDRLKEFLRYIRDLERDRLRLVMEFRHESWLVPPVFKLLEKYNVATATADSGLYPRTYAVTADFDYYRYHGPKELFASKYSLSQLQREAALIEKTLASGRDAYAYFNNDVFGFAPVNAKQLQTLCHHMRYRSA